MKNTSQFILALIGISAIVVPVVFWLISSKLSN